MIGYLSDAKENSASEHCIPEFGDEDDSIIFKEITPFIKSNKKWSIPTIIHQKEK